MAYWQAMSFVVSRTVTMPLMAMCLAFSFSAGVSVLEG